MQKPEIHETNRGDQNADEQSAALPKVEADAAAADKGEEQAARSLLIGLEAMLKAAAVPEVPLIGDIRRRLVTLFLGAPGVGKSLYALQLLIALATGSNFGVLRPTGAYKVVLLSPEDSTGVIGKRTAAMVKKMKADEKLLMQNLRIVDCEDPFVLFEKDGDSIRQTAIGRRLFAEIKAFGADAVCIDPVIEVHHLPESDNGLMHLLMGGLRDFAREADVAVIGLHHVTKPDGDKRPTINSCRGASAIVAAARHIEIFSELDKKEREEFRLSDDDCVDYFRVDVAKSSYQRRSGKPSYFQRVSQVVGDFEAPALAIPELTRKKQPS